nr:MAG TPA_asm: hypothetical protein [Caudoviricetes sp.]
MANPQSLRLSWFSFSNRMEYVFIYIRWRNGIT